MYEQIIRNVRSRTTAEVMMQKDHLTKWPPESFDPKHPEPDQAADEGTDTVEGYPEQPPGQPNGPTRPPGRGDEPG